MMKLNQTKIIYLNQPMVYFWLNLFYILNNVSCNKTVYLLNWEKTTSIQKLKHSVNSQRLADALLHTSFNDLLISSSFSSSDLIDLICQCLFFCLNFRFKVWVENGQRSKSFFFLHYVQILLLLSFAVKNYWKTVERLAWISFIMRICYNCFINRHTWLLNHIKSHR